MTRPLASDELWATVTSLREAFGCTGMTCWHPLRDRHEAGVLGDLHRVLLERLAAADELD